MLISVVIPTCHRDDLLAKCLDRLAPGRQSLGAEEYEVIVSDDGCNHTAEQMLRQRYPWAQWVAGPRRGPAANRNAGARAARGSWLAFMDDDCLPEPGWLTALANHAATADVVEGRTTIPDKVDHPLRQGVENLRGGVFWSCNLALRRELFWRLGGFDEDFTEAAGEDMELAFRIAKANLQVVYEPRMHVLHPVRVITWKGMLWRTRHIRWILLYAHKTGQALPLRAPAPLVLITLVRDRLMELARTTWHLVSKFDRTSWKTQLFWQSWKWITFPWVLPYLLVWEMRFRKQLASRPSAAPQPRPSHP